MEPTGHKRRLATILAADAAGYSALMAEDEEATLRTLKSHRQVIDKLIERHEGRIFKTAGDAVLAEFGSAVEAVRCAITIQDELRVRNAELVQERQLHFRIGINVGDVLVDGDDLLGDGVNIAARLEGIAAPGRICISGGTFEQVKNKLSVAFQDLGMHQVKNIPDPVAAFGVTSAPAAVKAHDGSMTKKAAGSLRRKLVPVASAVVMVAGAAAVGIWQFYPREPAPLSSFPANISTDDMRADEIAALMTGMTIQGIRAVDSQPFTIVLNADRTADYRFGRTGELAGTMHRETGRWRADDYFFCMQFRAFARGQEICPRIIKNGDKITATNRRDGTSFGWTLSK
jgi:adenylate cyclase